MVHFPGFLCTIKQWRRQHFCLLVCLLFLRVSRSGNHFSHKTGREIYEVSLKSVLSSWNNTVVPRYYQQPQYRVDTQVMFSFYKEPINDQVNVKRWSLVFRLSFPSVSFSNTIPPELLMGSEHPQVCLHICPEHYCSYQAEGIQTKPSVPLSFRTCVEDMTCNETTFYWEWLRYVRYTWPLEGLQEKRNLAHIILLCRVSCATKWNNKECQKVYWSA